MNKREYCESRESIAYYSGLNGLEIKGIEYGINDYVYCVSGAWGGGKAFHRCKIQYTRKGAAFFRVQRPEIQSRFCLGVRELKGGESVYLILLLLLLPVQILIEILKLNK